MPRRKCRRCGRNVTITGLQRQCRCGNVIHIRKAKRGSVIIDCKRCNAQGKLSKGFLEGYRTCPVCRGKGKVRI